MKNLKKVFVFMVDVISTLGCGAVLGYKIGRSKEKKEQYIRNVQNQAGILSSLIELDDIVINHSKITDEEKQTLKEELEDIRKEFENFYKNCHTYKEAKNFDKLLAKYKGYMEKIEMLNNKKQD